MRWPPPGMLIATGVAALASDGARPRRLRGADADRRRGLQRRVSRPATDTGPSIHTTGIAVGTPDDIDNRATRGAARQAARSPPRASARSPSIRAARPTGRSRIKVVAGVDVEPSNAARRTTRDASCNAARCSFVPNTTQRVTVRLSLACLNRVCGPNLTCDNGVCKNRERHPPRRRHARTTRRSSRRARRGRRRGRWCRCVLRLCQGTCTAERQCGRLQDRMAATPASSARRRSRARSRCDGTGHCNDIHCTTSEKCTIELRQPETSCDKVTCNAKECDVTCTGTTAVTATVVILLDASTKASLTCNGDNACTNRVVQLSRLQRSLQADTGAGEERVPVSRRTVRRRLRQLEQPRRVRGAELRDRAQGPETLPGLKRPVGVRLPRSSGRSPSRRRRAIDGADAGPEPPLAGDARRGAASRDRRRDGRRARVSSARAPRSSRRRARRARARRPWRGPASGARPSALAVEEHVGARASSARRRARRASSAMRFASTTTVAPAESSSSRRKRLVALGVDLDARRARARRRVASRR